MDPVAVVGAGPTGLMLAGDLARAGVPVTVFERRPAGLSNLSRAFGVHARTLETFDARGLADELLAGSVCRVPRITLFGNVRVDFTRIASPFNFMAVMPQYDVERVLLNRAERLGVAIRYGTEVVGLRQDPRGVELDLVRDSHAESTVRASHVAGCDGIRSTVRTLAGMPFPGHEFLNSMMLADVWFDDPPPGEPSIRVDARTSRGFAAVVPYGDGWWRIVCWHRDHRAGAGEPVDVHTLATVLAEAHGTAYGMSDAVRWLSRFDADERQVPNYRAGRVFVAGDAAHVHSPAGAQGMNVGIQDAANLAGVLTAVLRGADESVLDRYHRERRPVGRRVVVSAGGIIRSAIGPAPLRVPMRLVMRTSAVSASITRQLAAVNIRYPRPSGAHRLAGTHAGDLRLSDGARLYEALREQRPVVVANDGARLDGWDGRVRVVVRAERGPVLVVRTDGYIAWAGDVLDPAVLRPVLTGLCGDPGAA